MTLAGAIKQLHELRSAEDMPIYFKPVIAEVINVLLMDAQELRHGHWEMKEDPYGFFDEIPVCSECGHTTKLRETYKYCPNCEAKMDEDRDYERAVEQLEHDMTFEPTYSPEDGSM